MTTASAPSTASEPASTNRHYGLSLALAIVGAILFSVKAIIVKLAFLHGADYMTVVFYRMLFAFPLFVALAWWSGRGQPRLNRKDCLSILFLGFFGGYLTCVLDFAGLQYITASLERLIAYLTPTLVLLINVFVLKRRFVWAHAWALAASYLGVVLVLGHEIRLTGTNVPLGAALVFGSATTYAIYLSHSGEVVRRLGAKRLAGWATSTACLFSFVHFFATNPVSSLLVPAEVLGLSLINGIFCTFAPIVMVMVAISKIGAPLAAQCGMAGPVATVALGVLLLGEPFTVWEMCGTTLVLLGIWLLARARQQERVN
jgi:drug/metabolite transporter (DMT)-like permease